MKEIKSTVLVLRKVFVLALVILSTSHLFAQPSVKIGSQIWMTRNLDVDKFRNGDPIPHAATHEQWLEASNKRQPAWCFIEENPANGVKYGKLYNWFAVNDPRGLAPLGWHVATDEDWTRLTDYLGGESSAGRKLKSRVGWEESGNGDNTSGFYALPGGGRDYRGPYGGKGYNAQWWTSTSRDGYNSYVRTLNYSDENIIRRTNSNDFGYSVRCVKNDVGNTNSGLESSPSIETPKEEVEKVYTKVEVEPSFPGGDGAWSVFIKNVFQKNMPALKEDGQSGTVMLRFVVDKEGTVSDIEVETMKGTLLSKVIVDAIKNGPKWVPATQGGQKVKAWRYQRATFRLPDE